MAKSNNNILKTLESSTWKSGTACATLQNGNGQQDVALLEDTIVKQVVSQLTQIPWGYNIQIVTKLNREES